MPRRIEQEEAGGDRLRLPAGLTLKPAVTVEDLMADTECDPEGAEEFAALIRALRGGALRSVAL